MRSTQFLYLGTTMTDNKFVDPRLQAREAMFRQLHLSTFETMSYVRVIQEHVEKTGQDIDSNNAEYAQLLRDYEITKNMAQIEGSQLELLCDATNDIINDPQQALANRAQLCAAATSTINQWRILSEIPLDLRDLDVVTGSLKSKFNDYLNTWKCIASDLHNVGKGNQRSQ